MGKGFRIDLLNDRNLTDGGIKACGQTPRPNCETRCLVSTYGYGVRECSQEAVDAQGTLS